LAPAVDAWRAVARARDGGRIEMTRPPRRHRDAFDDDVAGEAIAGMAGGFLRPGHILLLQAPPADRITARAASSRLRPPRWVIMAAFKHIRRHPWASRDLLEANMKMIVRIGSGLAALAFVTGASLAQAPPSPPKPGPEQQRMARFAGKWTGKAEMKPSPFGPGGPMAWTESCDWFAGGFHIVCHSEGKGPQGEMKGLSIMGYDAEKKAYTFMGVDNSGWADYATGALNDKVWTFTSSGSVGGKPYHGRWTITEVSPTKQTFAWEMSEDGKTWTTMMTGESTK
jgi:uncharacterized protein DUF1579